MNPNRFRGPPSPIPELHWRGLVLRPGVEPAADLWPPEPFLAATLRAGRWQVTPNQEGGWVAAWRSKAVNIRSMRSAPEAALDALVRYLELRQAEKGTAALIAADLAALASL
jgi:hypothetical protein